MNLWPAYNTHTEHSRKHFCQAAKKIPSNFILAGQSLDQFRNPHPKGVVMEIGYASPEWEWPKRPYL
jgi:hypothetical protein